MSEGELLQIEKARKLDISEEIYFEIITKKTAALIAACCAAGVASVTNDEKVINQFKEFGINTGIAFQIKMICLTLAMIPLLENQQVLILKKRK
jgi:octaprenyl-diphosphate synthase